jgi:hypothetical protein
VKKLSTLPELELLGPLDSNFNIARIRDCRGAKLERNEFWTEKKVFGAAGRKPDRNVCDSNAAAECARWGEAGRCFNKHSVFRGVRTQDPMLLQGPTGLQVPNPPGPETTVLLQCPSTASSGRRLMTESLGGS